jgi:predicted glycoside hydrolase/deacetylase ChbG (UPF0249 family)
MTVYLLADDAGISDSATSDIIEAWQNKLLDGFSIVANTDSFLHLKDTFKKNSTHDCILSAHLNITDGKAIATHSHNAVISDVNGHLRISFVRALYLLVFGGKKKQLFLQEVYTEWDAQLSLIKEICGERKLLAINGHNHLHMIPSLFNIAMELSQKHTIPYIRVPKEHFLLSSRTNLLQPFFYLNLTKLIILSICRFLVKKKLASCKLFTEEVFGILFSGHVTEESVLKSIDNAKRRGVASIEIIFHPGQSVPSEMNKWASFKSGKNFFIHPNRKKEMDVLKQLQREQVLANKQN